MNAKEDATLFKDVTGIERDDVIEFSFAHRGRNGNDTMKRTVTDLGPDHADGGGDDKRLYSKGDTTGTSARTVYDSTTEPTIKAMGNKVRFAYSVVDATGGKGPANNEGYFLDSAVLGVVTVK